MISILQVDIRFRQPEVVFGKQMIEKNKIKLLKKNTRVLEFETSTMSWLFKEYQKMWSCPQKKGVVRALHKRRKGALIFLCRDFQSIVQSEATSNGGGASQESKR